MGKLRYFDDQQTFRTRSLGSDKFVIGRVESCQLSIVDDLVSREHSRLDRDPDGRYRIRDLGSRNKTFVNGQQVAETLLSHGDLIRIGNRVFEFLDDKQGEVAAELDFLTPDRQDPPGTEWIKIKEPISLPLARYGELATLGSDAGYPARVEDVAAVALGRLCPLLGADRGFVALRGESNKELRCVATRGLSVMQGATRTPVSQTFVYSALLQSVAGRYPLKTSQLDPKAGFAVTGLVAPLLFNSDVVGVLYVDRPAGAQPFPASAVQEMAAAGAHLGSLMADTSQRLVSAEQAVAPAWLATLRRLQLSLTVQPKSTESFDVSVKLLAGRSRCGDFIDVIPAAKGRMFLIVVDAGGQGVRGFVQAGGVRTALRTALNIEDGTRDLAAIMTALNRTMTERQARQLITCTVIDIDPAGGQIRYINAGGPPPLMLVAAGRLVTLDQPSLVLGIDVNYGYEIATLDLPASFRLVCHTDGLTEMCNAANEPLGTQRLHDLLLDRDLYGSSTDMIARITAACDKHRGTTILDDDAVIGVVGHG